MVELQASPFQQQVMMIPEAFDVFLGGGRGGGKSYALALLALRHAEQYRDKARILYVRKSYRALSDFELVTREVFGTVYGSAARYNGSEHVWRLPGGAYMELSQLEGPSDYSKFQGRSFSLLLIDEAGEYSQPADLDRLRSNLRGPKNVPIRTVMAANPGGVGHAWLAKRYVFKDAPWKPFDETVSARQWVYAPSTFEQNPALDQVQYRSQLRAACPTDPELLKAWLSGDWAIARGAYFGSVIDESRNAIDRWKELPDIGYTAPRGTVWEYYLAHDYGSSAPSVTYIVGKSPGTDGPDGRYYSRNSLVLIDELATVDPDNLNQGMGYTVPRLADEIKNLCAGYGVWPEGFADDAIFNNHGSAAGSIANEFDRAGVKFRPARKGDRVAGWETMRRLLADAGKPDVPGLYVSRACGYWWETVPYLGRDPRRVEDVDTRGPDHGADACRYACTPGTKPGSFIRELPIG
jgi:hypothetical protein